MFKRLLDVFGNLVVFMPKFIGVMMLDGCNYETSIPKAGTEA